MCERTARPALRLAPLSMRDARAAVELFHETVHAVNARDYTPEQLDAWAPGGDGTTRRLAERLLGQGALGAWEGGVLVGFGSLEGADLLDMLYVHKDYQGRGAARLIAGALEREACERGARVIRTLASIMARPFFEHRGYVVLHENVVVRAGVRLTNFLMEKDLDA
ncbi:GNAT family N-acetyltransferase [Thermophilibacter mediterraneus]|uniref:GNAT family N-acetyltransferase n=1 Tax=Thermophilibacter mediterraneus TaxID=1871031 RepID=UPI0032097D8D